MIRTHPDATPQAAALALWADGKPTIQSQLPLPFPDFGPGIAMETLQFKCTACDQNPPDKYFVGSVTPTEDGRYLLLGVGACPTCQTAQWCAWRLGYDRDRKFYFEAAINDYPIPVRTDGTKRRALSI